MHFLLEARGFSTGNLGTSELLVILIVIVVFYFYLKGKNKIRNSPTLKNESDLHTETLLKIIPDTCPHCKNPNTKKNTPL